MGGFSLGTIHRLLMPQREDGLMQGKILIADAFVYQCYRSKETL
jgi:hypothetical protein